MTDSNPDLAPDFAAARRLMVAGQLRPQGVTDARVLGAMGTVAREEFVGAGLQAWAYSDRPLRLQGGSSMMPPAELGQLLDRLAPTPGETSLVVGRGGAYAAAILAHIGLAVDSADEPEAVGGGPYDLILVEGAIDRFPASLARRLSPHGRVGAAIVEDGVTRLATGRIAGDPARGAIRFTSFAEAQVPRLPGSAPASAFVF